VPIPFFLHRETGALHPRTAGTDRSRRLRVEKAGIEAWFALDASELLGAEADQYRKMSDTLDVWFDSGVTHSSVLRGSHRSELAYPADLYLEGSDQHRGWFQSSLLIGCAIDGRAPYKALLTHGFVVDGKGLKMSKSKGQRHRPAEDRRHARRRHPAPVGRGHRLLGRTVDLRRDSQARRRSLPPHPQHAALPARQHLGFRRRARHAAEVEQWLEIDRYALAMTRQLQAQCEADYERSSSTASSSRCRPSAPKISAASTSTSSRTACTPRPPLRRRAARRKRAVAHPAVLRQADGADSLLHRRRNLATADRRREQSIMLQTWQPLPAPADEAELLDKWSKIRGYRAEVMRALEELRIAGSIGSSLQAEVTPALRRREVRDPLSLGDDLRFVLICSQTTLVATPRKLSAPPLPHAKCERCWHVRADVGATPSIPASAAAASSNLHGEGETTCLRVTSTAGCGWPASSSSSTRSASGWSSPGCNLATRSTSRPSSTGC
jgi:isoleucyl-tRNA synthetase